MFSPLFSHISDNIGRVVGDPEFFKREYFTLSNNCLDDIFTLKDLLDFEKS